MVLIVELFWQRNTNDATLGLISQSHSGLSEDGASNTNFNYDFLNETGWTSCCHALGVTQITQQEAFLPRGGGGGLCVTTWRTFFFFLTLQWQHTVHRYLRVLHSRMMKRPPKKVTMEEARKAHHIRCPWLSQGTSGEKGMITFILEMWMDGSGVNRSRFFGLIARWSPTSSNPPTHPLFPQNTNKQAPQVRFRRPGELQPAPPDAPEAQPCWVASRPSAPRIWLHWERLGRTSWVDGRCTN